MNDVNLLSGMKHEDEDWTDGARIVKLSASPELEALISAVKLNYNRITGRPQPTHEELVTHAGVQGLGVGDKVTLVVTGENLVGASGIVAREGRLFTSASGHIGLLPKGKKSKGVRVNPEKLLDVFPGWDIPTAREAVESVRRLYPDLCELTQERLDRMPGEDLFNDICSLALFGRWSLPWGEAPEAIWLIGEYWPGDDICDRAVLLLRPEHGVSETGSVYGRQLLNARAMGEIVDFAPIDWGEAVNLCNADFDEACRVVFGRAGVTV